MNDCIFCKIINGELPSRTVYEDDLIKVIMNINPTTNGHLLVLPKEHIVNIMDMKEEIIVHSFNIIKEKLYPLLKEKLHCEGLTISENNELGQEIKHFHIHLTPRYKDDLLDFNYNKDMLEDLDTIFTKLNN
ncbi:MAG: HIT domain-containing protein [Bacilli bacterium]|nr:HIT domain-containing protein [Bacilli bacterium]